jgi:hypothetical protein
VTARIALRDSLLCEGNRGAVKVRFRGNPHQCFHNFDQGRGLVSLSYHFNSRRIGKRLNYHFHFPTSTISEKILKSELGSEGAPDLVGLGNGLTQPILEKGLGLTKQESI